MCLGCCFPLSNDKKYGTCVCNCSVIDKSQIKCYMNPGLLVKVISQFNENCNFYVKDLTHFALIDSAVFKYLNAINDSKERYRFFNDASGLEYILHLAENTTGYVALPNGQWKKAKFVKIKEKDNKMFITVELLEKPEGYSRRSLEACAVSFKYSSKKIRYSLPPNMIKKIYSCDLNQKIKESLQIDKSLLECPECLTENFKDTQVNEVLNSEGVKDKDFTDKAVVPHEALKNQSLLDRQDNKVSKDESKNDFSVNDVTENAERSDQLIQIKVCDEGEVSHEHGSISLRVVENKEDHSEQYIYNTVCVICHYLNDSCSNVCRNCDEEISLQYNSQANVDSNINVTSSSLTETQINRWNCNVCFSPNNSILCSNCGEKKEERSLQTNSQTNVDSNLIVPLSSFIEIPLNPFAINEHHGLNNYVNKEEDLMNHDESTVRFNSTNETKCTICKNSLAESEGFFLRLCEHTVCKICTNNQITLPKLAHKSNLCCERSIELNEIRYFLPNHEYGQFKKYLIQLRKTNLYIQRCFDKNCSGYHLFEKHHDKNHKPSEFSCNKCKLDNCLNCEIIHHNLKCDDYLKLIDEGNSVDKETKEMFLTLISQGIAMLCPKCQALIEKDEGCDWVQCSFCSTEICWATRGPRWGPGGIGDTSGGCGCTKENKCTKNCNYCH